MNLYPYYKETALDPSNADRVDMNTDDVRVALLAAYTYGAGHKYLSDIVSSGGTIVAQGASALAGRTVTNGTFNATDQTLLAVGPGPTITSIVIYKHTGTNATSTVVCHIEKKQDGTTNISLPTNGSDILVDFHVAGLFDL